jgi:CPA1 family monovalent cation:H+ antiporter
VAAGITTNFADLRRSEFVAERIQTEGTWTMVESAFNGAVFLLLGLQLPSIIGATLADAGDGSWLLVGHVIAISVMLLGVRWAWLMLGVRRSLRRVHAEGKMAEPPSSLLRLATTVAGIRGAVTLAGALSVPLFLPDGSPFPARGMLIFLATGVIICTLLIGSIALPLILRRLPPPGEPPDLREERAARTMACRAALDVLAGGEDQIPTDVRLEPGQFQEVAGRLAQDYRKRIDLLSGGTDASMTPEALADAPDAVHQRHLRYVMELELRLRCVRTERDALYRERQTHHINDEVLRGIVNELDLSEISLRRRLGVARRAAGLGKSPRGH